MSVIGGLQVSEVSSVTEEPWFGSNAISGCTAGLVAIEWFMLPGVHARVITGSGSSR